MADEKDVVTRADSLMRPEGAKPSGLSPLGGRPEGATPFAAGRRRSFVAAPQPAPSAEPTAAAESPGVEEDDLPVLTEVVAPETAVSEAPPDRFDESLLSIIASDLVRTIEQQLAIELPTLIEATLLNAQAELRTGINATLELALRDFLARRQQLHLPLDEPNRED